MIEDPPLNGSIQDTYTLVRKNNVSGAAGTAGYYAARIGTE